MADGKRYYWLRLYEDFFTSKRIKKLRKIAGGDTYLIIYLKLQLKAMKSNGVINFDHVENTIAEEIALDIDEAVDDVKVALGFLVANGLAETNDNASYMFFPYAVSNVGSETGSAQRVREFRERQKVLHCNAGETDVKRIGNGEIEKEIYKEIEKDSVVINRVDNTTEDEDKKDKVIVYATSNLQYLSPNNLLELDSFKEDLAEDMIIYAIDKACGIGKRTYQYVKSILNDYVEKGYKTLGEVKAADDARQKERQTNGKRTATYRGNTIGKPEPVGPGDLVI